MSSGSSFTSGAFDSSILFSATGICSTPSPFLRTMVAADIGTRAVGHSLPCLVIAEAGVNHNGSLQMALRLVDAAAEARADIVKFQTFKSEEVVTQLAPKADYQVQNTGATESQLDMIRKLELPDEAFRTIQEHCRERGIMFLSTPFDHRSADLLEEMGVEAFKIPSGEITNRSFLAHVARKGKPLIVSTGMSNLDEVAAAIDTITAIGNEDVVLLHCVSNDPAAPCSVNLRAMKTLEQRFNVPVGYSTTRKEYRFRWPLWRAARV